MVPNKPKWKGNTKLAVIKEREAEQNQTRLWSIFCQTSKTEHFAKLVKELKAVNYFRK